MIDVGFPIWAELIVILICLIIAAISYNKSEFVFSIPLALVLTFYPYIFTQLGLTDLSAYELKKYTSIFTIPYFIIAFIVYFIINFISLKLATRLSSGQSTNITYVIIYIIVVKIITTIVYYSLLAII